MRRVFSVSVPILMLAVATPSQWRRAPNAVLPPFVSQPSLVPMPDGELFFFGGMNTNDWLWSGTHWSPVTTPIPRRDRYAIAVHGSSGDVILHGGYAGSQFINDMWRYDGNSWQQIMPPNMPTQFAFSCLGHDPVSDDMVLIGSTPSSVWETWRYDGADWFQSSATFGPTNGRLSMCTDTVRGVLTALLSSTNGIEVFGFIGDGWQLETQHSGLFGLGAAAFDPVRGRVVYYESHPTVSDVTYEYDGLTLRQLPDNVGVQLAGHAQAYDARRGEVVLVDAGGEIFSWMKEPRPFATAYGDPCVDPAFRLDLAPGFVPTIGAAHRLQAGAMSGAFAFAVAGFSHASQGGVVLPTPIPGTSCLQRVEFVSASLLGAMLPRVDITVPNDPQLLGVRYDAQFLSGDTTGIVDVTNGLEIQVGLPAMENALVESFDNDLMRDPDASGDVWSGGVASPVSLGGDGRHGAFDPSHGVSTATDVWQWNTDSQVIPANATLSGNVETIAGGRFFFSELVVPAGTTIDFVGTQPAQIHVRGRVDIAGSLRLNGAAMTTFDARGSTSTNMPYIPGQAGGQPGAGGGRGGRGGDECRGAGPIIVGGETLTDGGDGEDVQLLAGNGYGTQAVDTGGQGSTMNPASGGAAPNTPVINFVYRAYFAQGGGGGGCSGPGGYATGTWVPPNTQLGLPLALGGVAFDIASLPLAGYTSLDHYTIGGSGGGGGATHAYGTLYVIGDTYIAGAAGSGGGGACVIRSGSDLDVSGTLEAKGGAGVLIDGRDPNIGHNNYDWGICSPGGGGSGGSFLLQSSRTLNVSGDVDTSGGDGSRTGGVTWHSINIVTQAGPGASGFFRLESELGTTFTGSSVPWYNSATQSGTLNDTDARTGSRSVWLRPSTTELPRYLRYELLADINGSTVLFSDDAAVSNMAADDPNGAVMLRLQGAQLDPLTGLVDATTAGPWRTSVVDGAGTLNSDRAEALRFDLVLDKAQGTIAVRELRILWR